MVNQTEEVMNSWLRMLWQGSSGPFSIKEGLPDNLDKAEFFMTRQDDRWTLKRDNAYHYQIQLQLQVSQLHYCDFIVWTAKDFTVERIVADKQFFEGVVDTAQYSFVYGILP